MSAFENLQLTLDHFKLVTDTDAKWRRVQVTLSDLREMMASFRAYPSHQETNAMWLRAIGADRTDFATGLTEQDIRNMVETFRAKQLSVVGSEPMSD